MNLFYSRYNTILDKWEQCNDMFTQKCGTCCVVKKDIIHVIGGYDEIHGPLSKMDSFTPQTGRWNCTSNSLRQKRRSAGAAVVFIPSIKKSPYFTGL